MQELEPTQEPDHGRAGSLERVRPAAHRARRRRRSRWSTAATAFVSIVSSGGCHLPDTVELLAERDARILYAVDTSLPVVALTLDDGPDERTTPRLLEVLAAHGARATFFLIGDRLDGREPIVEAIVSEGHEIANHLTRDEPSVDLSPEDFEAELVSAHEALARFATPRWFRPGSGWYDDWMFPILDRHGYRMALGTAYPLDAAVPWVWFTSRLARWQVGPGEIVILHDAGARGERTARTLERILPELARRGLRVVTLSELVGYATSESGTIRASSGSISPSGSMKRQ